MMQMADDAKKKREETMPDEKSAIEAMFQAFTRLRELGWKEAMYCPKDGTQFRAIEAGSTGIHRCHYVGQWASGHFELVEAGDLWPSNPILIRLYPEDEAQEKARWAQFRENYAALKGPSHDQ